jgi:hypothetical protein
LINGKVNIKIVRRIDNRSTMKNMIENKEKRLIAIFKNE